MTEKLCQRCQKMKPEAEYSRLSDGKSNCYGYCKPCRLEYDAEWRTKNKAHSNAYHRRYQFGKKIGRMSPEARSHLAEWQGKTHGQFWLMKEGTELREIQDELLSAGLMETETVPDESPTAEPTDTIVMVKLTEKGVIAASNRIAK